VHAFAPVAPRGGRRVRVLIVDDDPHVRSAVRLLLENERDVSLVADRATADDLAEHVLRSRSEVVLIDWDLHPDAELQRLRRLAPRCCVVALSGRPEERLEALQGGAVSFVSKGDAPESLLAVLRGLRATVDD
jgi:DNA-binding NarL/FixJ family response regulator